jgi:hypothetical protein
MPTPPTARRSSQRSSWQRASAATR